MTDKPIKDKVNVKECKYYYCNGKCERYEEFVEADYANYSMKCICEEENCLGTYDVCDYQQLARKEQECEKLKEKLLRKRAIIEFADCPYYSYGDNTIEPTCNKNFCYDVKFCDHKNMVKLKQTLTEIREIAENVQSFVGRINIEDDVFEQMEQILQKISECEVENE